MIQPGVTVVARDPFPSFVADLKFLLDPRLDGPFGLVTYDNLPPVGAFPSLVILGDFDRLDAEGRARAKDLRRDLLRSRRRVLNDPARTMLRPQLLAALHAAGINDFRAHDPAGDRSGWDWPVFLRRWDDHNGVLTGLLHTPAEVDAAMARLAGEGRAVRLVAIEYRRVGSPDGIFRKYGALRIGEEIVAAHINFGVNWHAKHDVPLTPAMCAEELAYVEDFPHRAAVAKVFDLAGIDYGRIDYAVTDGIMRVWEINLLPIILDIPLADVPARPGASAYYQRLAMALNAEMRREHHQMF